MLKLCKINACSDGVLGLHLSRVPWDPYPWVSGIQDTSNAYLAGIRSGDTVLEINGFDIIGQKISELATLIRGYWNSGASEIEFLIWRSKSEENTINQQSLQKFATCLQNIAQLLECPICLEIVKPPGWQCCNGHVLCNSCRLRTTKCSICRATLGPKGRCLLADKLFTLLAESFPCNASPQNRESSCEEPKTIHSCSTDCRHKIKPMENYHCSTGKSCVHPNSSQVYSSQLLCSQWDVLTYLSRVHQLSVAQHYSTYGERIEVQLMNKSISCISLVPKGRSEQERTLVDASTQPMLVKASSELCDIEISPAMNQVLMSLDERAARSILSNRRTSTAPGDEVCASAIDRANDKNLGVEFVAKMVPHDGDLYKKVMAMLPPPEAMKDVQFSSGIVASRKMFKKIQAVIECKRATTTTTNKWNGFIHPLTKTWNSIRCQKAFLELEFDVANFFDIVMRSRFFGFLLLTSVCNAI